MCLNTPRKRINARNFDKSIPRSGINGIHAIKLLKHPTPISTTPYKAFA